MQRTTSIVLISVALSISGFLLIQYQFGSGVYGIDQLIQYAKPERVKNPLDGCLHVYLDMGTNRGIQIRKLYESSLYPEAGILEVFQRYFGKKEDSNYSEVCAVGFEGAKEYAETLSTLEETYRKCGWNVKIFTSTGVGIRDSEGSFIYNGVGGHFAEGNEANSETPLVTKISIARYIKEVVATRQLPDSSKYKTPRVMMKLDVEGLEKDIIPDILMSGASQFIDYMYVDYHVYAAQGPHYEIIAELKTAIQTVVKLANAAELNHILEISDLDDETYGDTDFPLPSCGKEVHA